VTPVIKAFFAEPLPSRLFDLVDLEIGMLFFKDPS
jgi:hypothetical protein